MFLKKKKKSEREKERKEQKKEKGGVKKKKKGKEKTSYFCINCSHHLEESNSTQPFYVVSLVISQFLEENLC